MALPRLVRIRQRIDHPHVADVPAAVRAAIDGLRLGGTIRRGARIAVTGTSRGVANIAAALRATVDALKDLGAEPFIVPAMGSHGGATAEGQVGVLARQGVTEPSMGCPIRATMEVIELGKMEWGLPVLVDREAAGADGIVLVNRVKPHTNFNAEIESGLFKMLTIGLGNHRGAQMAHRAAVDVGMARMVLEVGRFSLARLPIVCGIGLVENGLHQTARVAAAAAAELEAVERKLLAEAKSLYGRVPFDFLHLLVVDEMGKDISGTGMDTKVIGRMMLPPEPEPDRPRFVRILVRGLTAKTHGSAVGMGLADFTTRRLADAIDYRATYINHLTAASTPRAKLPMVFETDRDAVEVALGCIGLTDPEGARMVRIRNTLEVADLYASEALLPEVNQNPALEVRGEPRPMVFDQAGALLDPLP
jgi:hypothetical protein